MALVEANEPGGTCLHAGCIPTKALLRTAFSYRFVVQAAEIGVETAGVKLNWTKALEHKDAVVASLFGGLKNLLHGRGVDVITGWAAFEDFTSIKVSHPAGEPRYLKAARVILCPGSRPAEMPGMLTDGNLVMDTGMILNHLKIPQSLLIIGGGAVGCEFASLYAALDVKVYLVELLPRLLAGEDPDVSSVLQNALIAQGVEVFTSSRVAKFNTESSIINALIYNGVTEKHIKADLCLLAIGRVPNISTDMGLNHIGVDYTSQGLTVNDFMQTSVEGIYAAGDVIGGWRLAHVAYHEGWLAAENALQGNSRTINYRAVPRCVFTKPEVAAVGTTDPAILSGNARTVHLPLGTVGRFFIEGEPEGFIKIAFDSEYGEILGLTVVGRGAAEMVAAGVTLIEAEATVEELAQAILPHPTMSEALKEVAMLAKGEPFHYA